MSRRTLTDGQWEPFRQAASCRYWILHDEISFWTCLRCQSPFGETQFGQVTTMKIGYARVSTEDQKLDLQLNALELAGCTRIYSDQGLSGKDMRRPGLERAIRILKPGDMLVVWRLDRLGRSMQGLVKMIDQFGRDDIEFRSLSEAIDTSTSGGRLIFHMMAALAEFERSLISERTRAGMQAARQKGRHIGRPPALNPEQREVALRAVQLGHQSLEQIAKDFGIAPRTLRKIVRTPAPRQPG